MTIASNTAVSATANASTQGAQAAATAGSQQLAGNFDTFLQLLTTQLQNQNPLDPLDTNQFTQQLVEFASVEQQVNMNTNLQTLISLQQTSQATSAMQLIGMTAAVKSNTAVLSNASGSPAAWSFSVPSPATGQLSITNASGQTVYTGAVTLSPGNQTFTWNGQGTNGITWPDGNYTMSINATGPNGQPVTIGTEVQGTISGIDLSQNPPQVLIGGQDYAISAIQSISR
jgi:flagellar basal-body rod modification protein FlgD